MVKKFFIYLIVFGYLINGAVVGYALRAPLRSADETDMHAALVLLENRKREFFHEKGAAARCLSYARSLFGNTGNLGLINLLVTHRCPISCEMCYMTRAMSEMKDMDMPLGMIKDIAEQLHGGEEVYISGGEPFWYGKENHDTLYPSTKFWDMLTLLSSHAKKVTINTNGYFFLDKEVGREVANRLAQYGNINMVVSIDLDHGKAMQKSRIFSKYISARRKSPAAFSRLIYRHISDIAEEDGTIRIRENLFISRRRVFYEGAKPRIFYHAVNLPTDFTGYYTDSDTIFDGVKFKDSKQNKGFNGRVVNFFDDYLLAELPWNMFLFITPDGRVTINSYAAARSKIPDSCLLGDLNDKPLSQVLFEGIFGRSVDLNKYPDIYMLYFAHLLFETDYIQREKVYSMFKLSSNLHSVLSNITGYRPYGFIFPIVNEHKEKQDLLRKDIYYFSIFALLRLARPDHIERKIKEAGELNIYGADIAEASNYADAFFDTYPIIIPSKEWKWLWRKLWDYSEDIAMTAYGYAIISWPDYITLKESFMLAGGVWEKVEEVLKLSKSAPEILEYNFYRANHGGI